MNVRWLWRPVRAVRSWLGATGDDKARLADAWDEGFDAGYTHAAYVPGPSGVHPDPPRNPYEEHP